MKRIRVGTVGNPQETSHPAFHAGGNYPQAKPGTPVVICRGDEAGLMAGPLVVREPTRGLPNIITLSRPPAVVSFARAGDGICIATFEDLFGILPETFRELYEEPVAESDGVGDSAKERWWRYVNKLSDTPPETEAWPPWMRLCCKCSGVGCKRCDGAGTVGPMGEGFSWTEDELRDFRSGILAQGLRPGDSSQRMALNMVDEVMWLRAYIVKHSVPRETFRK